MVTMTTGPEVASSPANAFIPPAVITSVTPNKGQQGQTLASYNNLLLNNLL